VSFQTLSDIKAVFFDAADGGVSIWHVILFWWDCCMQMGDMLHTFNKPKQAEDCVPDIPERTDYCGR
jgi:hypothetical protein